MIVDLPYHPTAYRELPPLAEDPVLLVISPHYTRPLQYSLLQSPTVAPHPTVLTVNFLLSLKILFFWPSSTTVPHNYRTIPILQYLPPTLLLPYSYRTPPPPNSTVLTVNFLLAR